MNKTLALLSILVFIAFSGGAGNGQADQSTSQSVSKPSALDRPLMFGEATRAIVKDSEGQYVGKITDFVISPDGRISFAVLSPFPGVGGMNERLAAVPFNTLAFNDKDLVLNTTWEKLVNAPVFSRSYLNARSWAEDANRYFGMQPSWGEGKEEAVCEKPAGLAHPIAMTKGWNRSYEATEIVGTKVRNPQGEEIGKIDDLVFDAEGRVSFAILGYGGLLGIGQNLVAVPVNSLSYVEEPRHFILDITKEKIQSAPLFSKKTLDDPGWADGVYRYFGQQPYWTKEK